MSETEMKSNPKPAEEAPLSARQIVNLMAKAALKIGVIAKEQMNTHQNFSYRGIDDIYNKCHKAIFESGIIVRTKILNKEKVSLGVNSRGNAVWGWTVDLKISFVAPDDSREVCYMSGESQDTGDKGLSKAISVAMKYAFVTTFLIPTDELDPDGDKVEEVRPHGDGKKAQQPNKASASVKPAAPGNAKAEAAAKKTNAQAKKQSIRGVPLTANELEEAKNKIASMNVGEEEKIIGAIVHKLTNENITKDIASNLSLRFFMRLIELTEANSLAKVVLSRLTEFLARGLISESDRASVLEAAEAKAKEGTNATEENSNGEQE